VKITRALVGKVVEISWEDPVADTARVDLDRVVKGRAGLARWREFGTIYDVTDGVVILMHSLGYSPGSVVPDEGFHTKIVDDLITEVKVLEPQGGAGQRDSKPTANTQEEMGQ
jgi:hypothetical protein